MWFSVSASHLYCMYIFNSADQQVSWMSKVDPNGRLRRLPLWFSPNPGAMEMYSSTLGCFLLPLSLKAYGILPAGI